MILISDRNGSDIPFSFHEPVVKGRFAPAPARLPALLAIF
jgi:hypothetical protein